MKLLKLFLQKICRFLELCRIKEEIDVYPESIDDMYSCPTCGEDHQYDEVIEDTGIIPESEK